MLVFGKGYNCIKKECIIPISRYRVNYKAINSKSIKDEISKGKNVGFKIAGNEYVFLFDQDVLAVQLADSWKAYIRSMLQYDAAKKIDALSPEICPNWDIVSDYYYAFFCACTILRFCLRGSIFLDSSEIRDINFFITAIMGTPISLPNSNNFDYFLRKNSYSTDTYELVLKKSNGQTHETVWNSIKSLLVEMRDASLQNSDEYVVITSLLKVLSTLGATFPSKLRNEVNYQLKYGIIALEKKIYPAKACEGKKEKWLEPILTYDGIACSLEKRLELFRAYTEYLHTLMLNLVHEYDLIQGSTGVRKALNKHRTLQIENPEGNYNYS